MNGYTVTITPSGNRAGPRTTIRVDTTAGTPRVTDVSVRASHGNGLSPQQLPAIDLAALITAVAPPAANAGSAATTPTRQAAAAAGDRSRARPNRRKTTADRPATGRATTTRGRRRAAGATTVGEPNAARAYRRMPDTDTVVAAWHQTGSASALAEHFDVPRHTANGWLRRLRNLGLIQPAS
jgi:hypothetical protein